MIKADKSFMIVDLIWVVAFGTALAAILIFT